MNAVISLHTIAPMIPQLPRTLIADDDPDIIAALRLLLKSQGYEPDSVSSPAAVLEAIKRSEFDVVLIDLNYARDTTSDIVWRGVADQRSRGVFHGAITVAAGADGADAQLSNKNLLLSANAEIDTQPVLEIYADEVKAAHGATVGQLDEDALFYLRSRGLAPDAARRLLISAFCSAVLSDLSEQHLREHLDALLAARLPQATEE